jgi:hypothetical protein
VTLEHRLITGLTLVCAAQLGIAIASAEILSQIDWAAADGACTRATELPADTPNDALSTPFRA